MMNENQVVYYNPIWDLIVTTDKDGKMFTIGADTGDRMAEEFVEAARDSDKTKFPIMVNINMSDWCFIGEL